MCLHRKHFIQTMGNCFGSIDQDYQNRQAAWNSRSQPTYSSRAVSNTTFTPRKQVWCTNVLKPSCPPFLTNADNKYVGSVYIPTGY